MTKQVFVSYSTQDTASAEQVRDGLEDAGLTCWMAPRDIAPGLDYGTQIIDAIEACTVLVLVLSESSNYSIYVRKEVERAIAKGKVVIPVRIQEVAVSRSLEFFISDAQWIDAWDGAWARVTTTLHSAVRGHLADRGTGVNAPPAPTPRPSLASDLLPSPTHSPSPTHQPPAVERALFVGREPQMAELENALTQSLQGHGQLRFVTGEAGAGKSALLNEFQFRAREQDAQLLIVSGACDAQTGASDPYLPFREILTALAREDAGRAALLEHGPDLIDTLVPGTALGSHRSGPGRSPDAKPVEQSQIFEQVVHVLQTIAQRLPLVLILEDLHWVDDASNGLLFRLGRQLEGSRILLLGTYRSEEVSLGRDGEIHPLQKVVDELRRILGTVHVDLDAARETEGLTLVEALLDAEPNRLDGAFRRSLYEHTGGHPLFMVELLRDLQSEGGLMKDADGRWIAAADLNWSSMPDRVEGIIAVRIDRLDAEERQLLTTASVMGQHFVAEAVANALHVDSRLVAQQLSGPLQKQHRLVQIEGVERLGRQRITHCRFGHHLMQVYLYAALDVSERSFLHEDVGYVLEDLYGEQASAIAVQLAYHFEAADLPDKAMGYLIRAGEQAAHISAHAEAIQHFNHALELLAQLPQDTERDRIELDIQFNLGRVFSASEGYGAQNEGEALARALKLARQLGESQILAQVLHALTWHAIMKAEMALAQAYAEESLRLAEENQDFALQMVASRALHILSHGLGQHAAAVMYADRVIAYYENHRPHWTPNDVHELVLTMSVEGLNLIAAGYPDRALRQVQEGLVLIQDYPDPLGLGVCLGLVSSVHLSRGEWQAALQFADEQRSVSLAHDIPMNVGFGNLHRSWAMAMLGEIDEGLELMRHTIRERRAMNIHQAHSYILTGMADACGRAGRVAEGLSLIDEAQADVERMNDRQAEAWAHRVKGDLLLLQSLTGDELTDARQAAEEWYRRSIAVAKAGGAKLWEARAMASLCRLQEEQGREETCRQELADLYAWFTEGFETEDLQVVKAVLDAGDTGIK